MPRYLYALLVLAALAPAQDRSRSRNASPVSLEMRLKRGQRFTGSNTVSYVVRTSVTQGDSVQKSMQSVERTERFLDRVLRSGSHGVLEIERTYLKLFTKARTSEDGRPEVYQSPLQGQKVMLRERKRRREVKVDTRGVSVEQMVRRTAGIELDWRDIFPEDEVAPGQEWDGDAAALAKRMGAFLNSGTRTKMRVRFEEVVRTEDARLAKLYVDWTLEGMRDRHLFTKVTLAGDVFLDLDLKRVVEVDLIGNMVVRGAIIGSGQPRIVRGSGQVLMKSSLKIAPEVEASADPD